MLRKDSLPHVTGVLASSTPHSMDDSQLHELERYFHILAPQSVALLTLCDVHPHCFAPQACLAKPPRWVLRRGLVVPSSSPLTPHGSAPQASEANPPCRVLRRGLVFPIHRRRVSPSH